MSAGAPIGADESVGTGPVPELSLVELTGDCRAGASSSWPNVTLLQVGCDGRMWLTNKVWFLDFRVVIDDWWVDDVARAEGVEPPVLSIRPFPADAAHRAVVGLLVHDEVLGSEPFRVDPMLAGVFSAAEYRVLGTMRLNHCVVGVLGDRFGNRVGALAEYRGDDALPIPVPRRVVALREGIGSVAGVTNWQAWHVAAHLAKAEQCAGDSL